MDPIDVIDVNGDSTYMMMLEAARRSQGVFWCTPTDLFVSKSRCHARCQMVIVSDTAPHFQSDPQVVRDLGHFDVVWLRKDPPFDINYVFTTYMLDLVPASTMVLNNPASIRDANEKMVALRFADLVPDTLVTREVSQAMEWIDCAPGKVVLKPWDGNGGRGIMVSQKGDGNLRSMLEVLTDGERTHILVQAHIPEISQGDKRIILIDGEAVGWVNRVPQAGDHRGNMHVVALVEPCDMSDTDKQICAEVGPWLKDAGLLFVGIDTIGPYMTEINVTSPTGIQEINRLMGVQLEKVLADAVADRLALHRKGEVP